MPDIKQLNNAPIKEAIIDIQTNTGPEFDIELFKTLPKDLAKQYQKCDLIQSKLIGFDLSADTDTVGHVQRQERLGYRFENTENSYVAQLRKNGFTFSRLKPYEDWKTFKEESILFWKHYADQAQIESVSRIAVRYINFIELPMPVDLADYLTEPPKVTDGLTTAITGFLSRLVIEIPEINNANCNITLTLDSATHECGNIFFDIDAFIKREYILDEEDIWKDLNRLRDFKNKVFFKSLSEKALELFK